MKIKASKLKDLSSIGFVKVALKENSPLSNASITKDMSDDEVRQIIKLENEFQKSHYVAYDDYDGLYYHEGCWVFEIGHSRRGQSYYVIINKDTNEVQILATEPDGSGGIINAGDIFKVLIENGFIT
jgi:hypothetical protein